MTQISQPNIATMKGSEHDVFASMAKAVLIMLMVIGHSGVQMPVHDYIYLFHMPAFFFLAGYLFKEKYFDTPIAYVKRKLKTHYLTYLKWSLIFLALHQLFLYSGLISKEYSLVEYFKVAAHMAIMGGTEELLGALWFLKELLYASLIVYFTLRIFRIRSAKWSFVLSFVFILLANVNYYSPVHIFTITSRVLTACAFFTVGYAYKKSSLKIIRSPWLGLAIMIAFIPLSLVYNETMDSCDLHSLCYFFVGSTGAVGVLNCMNFIPVKVRPVLDFVGSRTIYILIFHLICFKIVSAIKILHLGLSWESMSDFPIIGEANDFYWIAYTLVGVLVPLGLLELYRATVAHIRKLKFSKD